MAGSHRSLLLLLFISRLAQRESAVEALSPPRPFRTSTALLAEAPATSAPASAAVSLGERVREASSLSSAGATGRAVHAWRALLYGGSCDGVETPAASSEWLAAPAARSVRFLLPLTANPKHQRNERAALCSGPDLSHCA